VGSLLSVGVYTDPEHMSLALTDALVCLEMPFFAIAHVSQDSIAEVSHFALMSGTLHLQQYAFQASDYIDHSLQYSVSGCERRRVVTTEDLTTSCIRPGCLSTMRFATHLASRMYGRT
jgi:hypothetical protein